MTFFEQVYALVARIPEGRVATYGQLAAMLGPQECGPPGHKPVRKKSWRNLLGML